MSGRLFAALAWALWALTAAAILLGVVLAASVHALSPDKVMTAIAFNAFPLVGALIVSRRPRNAVGWICLAIGLGTATTFLDAGYRVYCTLAYHKLTPLSLRLDWVGNSVWPLNVSLAAALMMLFPTGRPLTPRWRWLLWALVVDTFLTVASYAVLPGTFSGENVTNPAGVPALQDLMQLLNNVSQAVQYIILLLAAASAIVRFWRSRGVEREQMKWFAFGIAALVFSAVLSFIFLPDGNNTLFAIGVVMIPIGIGIAVLRYRLYDIDVIIRRTLIYGTLTATLAVVYFAVVLVAQILGERLTGQTRLPPWLIVATTLLIAALFTPLRRRTQATIDRRFYRRKYDAARTLQAFAATLRTETDLEQLTAHLVGVVQETMQPAHVSLWLRAHERRGGEPGGATRS